MLTDFNEENTYNKNELIEQVKVYRSSNMLRKRSSQRQTDLMIHIIENVMLSPDEVTLYYHAGIEYGHLIYKMNKTRYLHFEVSHNEVSYFMTDSGEILLGPIPFKKRNAVKDIDMITKPLRLERIRFYE